MTFTAWRMYCSNCGCAFDQNPTVTAAGYCHCGVLSFQSWPVEKPPKPCPKEAKP